MPVPSWNLIACCASVVSRTLSRCMQAWYTGLPRNAGDLTHGLRLHGLAPAATRGDQRGPHVAACASRWRFADDQLPTPFGLSPLGPGFPLRSNIANH
jgi:hypothetical protein